MPTLDNSAFACEVLHRGAVPREEIGGVREGALCRFTTTLLPLRPLPID
jgi:hypothetical protein